MIRYTVPVPIFVFQGRMRINVEAWMKVTVSKASV
jgi:hypothetical protein